MTTQTTPYFIVAPPYTSKSAGVVTLYRLCHYLNDAGQKAWIMPIIDAPRTCPYLNAPIITREVQEYFNHENIEPIFVYPDIIKGNPFNAKRVVWYMLHYPGVYGGQPTFSDQDIVWSFSPNIADHTPRPLNVLSVPNIDLDIFRMPQEGSQRTGGCYYANKYLAASHKILSITEGMTRLEGTHQQMAKMLQTHETCYVYENTSVISEAVLCGCNIVLVRSNYFTSCHSLETQTLGAGVRWLEENGSLGDIMQSISYAKSNYGIMFIEFLGEQLKRFMSETQAM